MDTPELQSKHYTYRSGFQYACLFIENSMVFEEVRENPPTKSEVKNRDILAGITVFDQWVNNSDRGTKNVILERLDEGGYYVQMIDHGRVFPGRYEWTTQTLTQKPEYNYHWPFYNWTYSMLNSPQELTSFIDKIVNLPNESIYEVIHSLPDEWNISLEEKEALYMFLLNQKKNLPKIVESIIHYHSSGKKAKK
jgi:hypothetical protein